MFSTYKRLEDALIFTIIMPPDSRIVYLYNDNKVQTKQFKTSIFYMNEYTKYKMQ